MIPKAKLEAAREELERRFRERKRGKLPDPPPRYDDVFYEGTTALNVLAYGEPQRIQRKRTKGWTMPPNTVYVGRPTQWGNWWTVWSYYDAGYSGSLRVAQEACVELFRAWMTQTRSSWHGIVPDAPKPRPDVSTLRGKNLACWCPLDQPCHADVLLELANR